MRVMQLPPAKDAFVVDEATDNANGDDRQSKITPGKIVSNGPQKPPGRQVSETDLYLLGAIEKLVYRVDFMEKRLRRVEEMLYFVMAGNRVDHGKYLHDFTKHDSKIYFPEPCPANFTRVASTCYFFYGSAGREYDWKAASTQCKRVGAVLAELETIEENQDVIAYIQSNAFLRGKDFWTGGLNPGLLWIWSNSARPVASPGNNNNKNPSFNIKGEGRCLRLAYDPALRSYTYKGTDCSVRYGYICELPETSSSNEIKRLGSSRKILDE